MSVCCVKNEHAQRATCLVNIAFSHASLQIQFRLFTIRYHSTFWHRHARSSTFPQLLSSACGASLSPVGCP